jgi:hypothetical protein
MKNILIVFCVGIVFSLLFSSGQIENPDTHLRLTQTRIMVDDHSVGLPNNIGEDSHGNIAINSEGKRFMVYNLGQSIVFIPIYIFAENFTSSSTSAYYLTAFLVSFINYLIHVICTFLLYKISIELGRDKKTSIVVALFFGLTSYSFVFAQSTYEHHFEMLAILACYYLALNKSSRNIGVLIGLCVSLGMVFRTTTIFVVPGIILLLNNRKYTIQLIISSGIGVFGVLLYNYLRFDNIFQSGYSLAWSLAHGAYLNDFWSLKDVAKSIFGFVFSPGKGLLFFSSTMFLSIFYFRSFYKRNDRFVRSILATITIYFIVFSANFAWHGSVWSFGPRYILPVLPLLYLPLIELKIKKWIYVVISIAFISQIILISVNYKRNVLESYTHNSDFSEIGYIYHFSSAPQFSQVNQLMKVARKNSDFELKNFQPNTYWVKEQRLGTNKDVLEHSIEKNSINFWWVRILHWKLPTWVKCLSTFIFGVSLLMSIKFFKYVRKELQ